MNIAPLQHIAASIGLLSSVGLFVYYFATTEAIRSDLYRRAIIIARSLSIRNIGFAEKISSAIGTNVLTAIYGAQRQEARSALRFVTARAFIASYFIALIYLFAITTLFNGFGRSIFFVYLHAGVVDIYNNAIHNNGVTLYKILSSFFQEYMVNVVFIAACFMLLIGKLKSKNWVIQVALTLFLATFLLAAFWTNYTDSSQNGIYFDKQANIVSNGFVVYADYSGATASQAYIGLFSLLIFLTVLSGPFWGTVITVAILILLSVGVFRPIENFVAPRFSYKTIDSSMVRVTLMLSLPLLYAIFDVFSQSIARHALQSISKVTYGIVGKIFSDLGYAVALVVLFVFAIYLSTYVLSVVAGNFNLPNAVLDTLLRIRDGRVFDYSGQSLSRRYWLVAIMTTSISFPIIFQLVIRIFFLIVGNHYVASLASKVIREKAHELVIMGKTIKISGRIKFEALIGLVFGAAITTIIV